MIPKRQSGIQAVWRESCGAILYEITEKTIAHRLIFGIFLPHTDKLFLVHAVLQGNPDPLAGGVQKAAPQHPAHISADIVCSGFFPGKGSGHSRFLSVVIIAEGMAAIMDGFLSCF